MCDYYSIEKADVFAWLYDTQYNGKAGKKIWVETTHFGVIAVLPKLGVQGDNAKHHIWFLVTLLNIQKL